MVKPMSSQVPTPSKLTWHLLNHYEVIPSFPWNLLRRFAPSNISFILWLQIAPLKRLQQLVVAHIACLAEKQLIPQKINMSREKGDHFKRKGLSSNHDFSQGIFASLRGRTFGITGPSMLFQEGHSQYKTRPLANQTPSPIFQCFFCMGDLYNGKMDKRYIRIFTNSYKFKCSFTSPILQQRDQRLALSCHELDYESDVILSHPRVVGGLSDSPQWLLPSCNGRIHHMVLVHSHTALIMWNALNQVQKRLEHFGASKDKPHKVSFI